MTDLSRGATVLMYHRIADPHADPWGLCVSPRHFAEHLELLRARTTPIRLQDLHGDGSATSAPLAPPVILTFDDGYADNLDQALPLLERFGVPATVFIVSGCLPDGGTFWWDDLAELLLSPRALPARVHLDIDQEQHEWELGADRGAAASPTDGAWRAPAEPVTRRQAVFLELWRRIRVMSVPQQRAALNALRRQCDGHAPSVAMRSVLTRDELARLAASPLVEIGAHSVTHRNLTTLSAAEQHAEIAESKATVEQIVGRSITSFSYPFGEHTDVTVAQARAVGIHRACTTTPGLAHRQGDPLQIPRFQVPDCDGASFGEFLVACQAATP